MKKRANAPSGQRHGQKEWVVVRRGFQSASRLNRLFLFGLLILGGLVLGHSPALGASAKENFSRFCAQCHGFQGKGDGVNAPHLDIAPRDLTDADQMARRTDDEIARTIKKGGAPNGLSSLMPPWGNTLSRQEIDDLVGYIHDLCQCGPGPSRRER